MSCVEAADQEVTEDVVALTEVVVQANKDIRTFECRRRIPVKAAGVKHIPEGEVVRQRQLAEESGNGCIRADMLRIVRENVVAVNTVAGHCGAVADRNARLEVAGRIYQ